MTDPARRRRERVIALFVLGALAFNYPLLSLFAVDGQVFGIPLLVAYLFLAWACFIGLTWWIVGRNDRGNGRQRDRL
ncbi:hypothetical protein M0534_06285 [Methylonatrum kenyense]|uniref:hypothetical protein n=1 Tax=Methylonatrum kenyense TaxID=455253 RepID=UPI0020C1264C|nr:hypothetical protein [Methylonatrum kenyense]MCK8515932.1 hypothetical protein [Methylonatrum kenyense]